MYDQNRPGIDLAIFVVSTLVLLVGLMVACTHLPGCNIRSAAAGVSVPSLNAPTVKTYGDLCDAISRCIVGEAASEGITGMIAVAEAIRNRGTLKGVYGCKSDFVNNEPKWVFDNAKLACEESMTTNLVKGATHWESTDFPVPYWADKMEMTAKIGKHKFYKEIN